MAFLLQLILLFFVSSALYAFAFLGRRARSLPDGPPTLPVIGNLHQIPTKGAHLKFTEWARTYGGIFSLKLGPATAVVLTDRRLIKQMIDKKSAIYSNRPASYVSHDLITGGDHVLVMQYSDLWRQFRKLIHQYFMESECESRHIILQNAEAIQMIRDFVSYPQDFMAHPKRFSNSIIMSLLYGIRTPTINTTHMKKLYDLMDHWSKVMEPGATPPVDIFPFLHWVPERLFGNWRSRASHVGKEMNELYAESVAKVDQRRAEGQNYGSFVDKVLDQNEKLGLSRHEMYFLTGTLMEGGSDTTSSIVIAFVQAMTKYPKVQERARQEIDSVVGEDRSPLWSDYEKLPYIAACVKEAMRWRPVVPLAFPHALAESDYVDGKLLPKGTVIFINAWGLHHDVNRYSNPDNFDPEHFLGQMKLAPELAASDYESRDHYGYGSGRRICPGIHLAERNLFLAIAKIVWACHFTPGKDGNGRTIEPDTDPVTGYSEGFLVCARPFACDIQVRSEAKRSTIFREFEIAEREVFSKYQT